MTYKLENQKLYLDGLTEDVVAEITTSKTVTDKFTETTGDDAGLILDGQLAVTNEIISGGDSYPVTIAFHCDNANTSGTTITSAIDVTAILQSDTGSSTGLFGGAAAGDYILVGAPQPFEGAKVKYNTLETVDPNSIVAEYYESTGAGWQDVPFMGTNNAYPHEANGWNIALHDIEQIYFGYDPLTRFEPEQWEETTFNINGDDYTYYWARYRVIANITADPQVEQIKLHTNRCEFESTGIFKYGRARNSIALPFEVVKNDNSDPANEIVDYTPTYSADFVDNELVGSGATDGFGVIVNRVFGVDTSVPLVIGLSFYVKGTNTGDIKLRWQVSQATDGYIYDGSEPFDQYEVIIPITSPQDLQRFSVQLPCPINQLESNSGIVVNIERPSGDVEDTLTNSIIRTNVNATATTWRG